MKRTRQYYLFALAVLAIMAVLALTRTAMAETVNEPGTSSTTALAPNQTGRHPGDVSFLTGPNAGEPLQIVQAYLNTHKADYGLTEADLSDMIVTDQYTDAHNGVTHIYLRQRYQGIEVFGANISTHVTADGRIINLHSAFIGNLADAINATSPSMTPEDAVASAAAELGLTITEPLTVLEEARGVDSYTLLSNGGISFNPIPARLVYVPSLADVLLTWDVEIETLDSLHWWSLRVDTLTGKLLSTVDYVIHENHSESADLSRFFVVANNSYSPLLSTGQSSNTQSNNLVGTYNVYAMPVHSPIYTTPLPPADARSSIADPDHAPASPFGWHDTNGVAGAEFTTTQGNNVHAYTDVDANNTPDPGSSPDGGAGLVFNFPLDLTQAPSTYRPAAVTNLFYWNNIIHDVYYTYGFTEAAGNFQVNNYGNGGLGNDYVRAEAQDGSGTNNANFSTPPDGQLPRMQMFIGTNPTPDVDGDLDNHVIVHEYGHGISNRLTGGPSTTSCLSNSEQMGEGWSDWLGLTITHPTGATATMARPVGNYLFGQPANGPGIRPAPYTTDITVNTFTYANVGSLAVPHGVGFLWATMTWDMYWDLIDAHGFNPDFYAAWSTGGNNLAMQLVLDGMKLQPCSPGFVDGRNAILSADQALTGGENQCLIWEAFARRGLGFSASQGSSSSTSDGTPAFDIPPACSFLGATPASQSICVGTPAAYNVTVGQAFTGAVAMSAAGHPAGTTAVFAPNPVTAPGSTTLTIGNTAGATPGSYNINITGVTVTETSTTTVGLDVLNAAPTAPTLVSPPNGASGVGTSVTLSWNASASATGYTIEVATDAAFTNIIHTNTVVGTSDNVGGLAILTTYYWRVRATNPCGTGVNSAVFSFTTGQQFCVSTPITIPASGAASPYPSNNIVAGIGTSVVDVDVILDGLSHTWPDDIDIMIVGPQGQNLRVLSDAGGSTDVVNGDITFDDSAAAPVPDAGPLVTGSYQPSNYEAGLDPFPAPAPAPSAATTLATFNGTDPNGTWSLYVVDDTGGDSGSITGWCLQIATGGPTPTPTATATATAVPPTATPTATATATATVVAPTATATVPPTDVQLSSVAGNQAGSGWFTVVVGILLLGLAGFLYVRRQPTN